MLLNEIKEMRVVYQPKINLKTKKIESVEVLARFFDKDGMALNTDKVIGLVKNIKDMRSLTNVVIEKTIKDMKNIKFYNQINFSINISSIEIEDNDFKTWIDNIILKYDKKYLSKLDFEITEKYEIKNEEKMKERIEYLRRYGFKVAFDDIGSGYNTFEVIDSYNIDFIKIDRSLVKNINKYNKLIINNIKKAHLLGKKVIAEGIENENTYYMLRLANCDFGQGFYFYKPMDFKSLNSII